MNYRTLEQHLSDPAPKRILTLDGGGVRGILTLGFLARIESILRARHNNDHDFRLCHYFDLIGGTSTGAIIAAGLATGMSVGELQTLYRKLANTIFQTKGLFPAFAGLLSAKFPTDPLTEALRGQFGDTTLGGAEIKTGLMVMSKRFDTGSPWVMHNHPRGKYFSPAPGSDARPNSELPLWQIVRASTAAPHYFEPERIQVASAVTGKPIDGAFVDGGVSPHNNPSLQALLLASLGGYGWNWELGEDQLLVVSVGTGYVEPREPVDKAMKMPAAELALRSLALLMDDCSWLVQTLMQWMGRSPTNWKIDSEVGDIGGDSFAGKKWFQYLRYDAQLSASWLNEKLNAGLQHEEAEKLAAMDDPKSVPILDKLGERAGMVQVQSDHFPAIFDLR